jgi:hypothetical protein
MKQQELTGSENFPAGMISELRPSFGYVKPKVEAQPIY